MKNKGNASTLVCFGILLLSLLICTVSYGTNTSATIQQYTEIQSETEPVDRTTWKWSPVEVVSLESNGYSRYSSLAIDSKYNRHIAWADSTNYTLSGIDYDIFYKCWNMTTRSWSLPEVITVNSTEDSSNPSVAIDNNDILHLVWGDWSDLSDSSGADLDIFYRNLDCSSSIWSDIELVSTESTGNSLLADLSLDPSGNVHVSWRDDTDYGGAGIDWDIFYKYCNASTSLWSTTELVSTVSTDLTNDLSLDVDCQGSVHIAWEDSTDHLGAGGDMDILYITKDVSTSSWSSTKLVSAGSTGMVFDINLVVDYECNPHISWKDSTVDLNDSGSDADVFYRKWDSTISNWSNLEVISVDSNDDSSRPQLAIGGEGTVHIVWSDSGYYEVSGTDADVFYKTWNPVTMTWSSPELVTTDGTNFDGVSALLLDDHGILHLSWYGDTEYYWCGSDFDVFYRQFGGPPEIPELAFIIPNPSEDFEIYLDWNDIFGAASYSVYRSPSFIWSIEELTPLSVTSSSEFLDTVSSADHYYYVITAENYAGNSSCSNCEYVEVLPLTLEAPELAPLISNPTDQSNIPLLWNEIENAIEYYIYRSTDYIWSLDGLTPIATVFTNSFDDTLSTEGTYFYVIVASDGSITSAISNCVYVEYKLPTLYEFNILPGLVVLVTISPIIISLITKKKMIQR